MNKLIKYISFLLLILSSVYITREIINFKKDIILLESHQSVAVIKTERMLQPSVMITMISLPEIDPNEPILDSGLSAEDYLLNNFEVRTSSATGFSISYDAANNRSLVVTNDHFCKEYSERSSLTIEKSLQDRLTSDPKSLSGYVLYSDASKDLCLIIAEGYIRPVVIADYSYEPVPFEQIYIVGAPNGNFPIIIDTYISGFVEREEIRLGKISKEGNNFIIVSEQIIRGHSGSAVFSETGEVIGVVFATMGPYGGVAISHRDLIILLEETSQ